ncbi:MAG: AAA family ATPase [Pseudomonadota bacterium]
MRINVVGTSGSGKSTLSKALAKTLGIPYVQLDALHWKPNWAESTDDELFTKLRQALIPSSWVLDGNYTRTIPIKWPLCDAVVFLDLPFRVVLYRIVKRSLRRGLTREALWHGNRETVWKHLFTRDSMILWTLKTYHANRRKYAALMEKPEFSHIRFVVLRSTREVRAFREEGVFELSGGGSTE